MDSGISKISKKKKKTCLKFAASETSPSPLDYSNPSCPHSVWERVHKFPLNWLTLTSVQETTVLGLPCLDRILLSSSIRCKHFLAQLWSESDSDPPSHPISDSIKSLVHESVAFPSDHPTRESGSGDSHFTCMTLKKKFDGKKGANKTVFFSTCTNDCKPNFSLREESKIHWISLFFGLAKPGQGSCLKLYLFYSTGW